MNVAAAKCVLGFWGAYVVFGWPLACGELSCKGTMRLKFMVPKPDPEIPDYKMLIQAVWC